MDKHDVGETQGVFVFSSAYAFGTDQILPTTFKSFQPETVVFELDRNFHPPSSKLPVYFSKQSFLI